MPTRIRLSRHGRKRKPYYHILVADGRAPRDGKYIERLGMYDPNTNPATIELDFDKALSWLQQGAQPSETVRTILSYKGVLYKKHLLEGVKKGAFSEEESENRFESWMNEKQSKIQAKIDKLSEQKRQSFEKQLNTETKIKEERLQKITERNAELAKEVEAATKEAEATTETEVAAEEAQVEAPVEKAKEETPAKEAKEESPVEKAKEETPKAEEKPAKE